jgi:hypothetical protein
MDSLVGLFAMEASGIVDAEIMVKGVVPIAVCFSPIVFLRGSFVGQAWVSSEHLRSFPNRATLFYRVIAGLPVSAPHQSHSHPIMVEVHLPARQLCAPLFVHRPAKSWLLGDRS